MIIRSYLWDRVSVTLWTIFYEYIKNILMMQIRLHKASIVSNNDL